MPDERGRPTLQEYLDDRIGAMEKQVAEGQDPLSDRADVWGDIEKVAKQLAKMEESLSAIQQKVLDLGIAFGHWNTERESGVDAHDQRLQAQRHDIEGLKKRMDALESHIESLRTLLHDCQELATHDGKVLRHHTEQIEALESQPELYPSLCALAERVAALEKRADKAWQDGYDVGHAIDEFNKRLLGIDTWIEELGKLAQRVNALETARPHAEDRILMLEKKVYGTGPEFPPPPKVDPENMP